MEMNGTLNTTSAPVWQKALSIVIVLLAVAYDVSPIDISPDAVPVVGWIDDIGITAVAALNAVEKFCSDQSAFFVRLLRYTKWFLVILVVIALIAFAGLIAGIIALVHSLVG